MSNSLSGLSAAIMAGAQDVLEQEFVLPKIIDADFRATAMRKGDPITVGKRPGTLSTTACSPSNTLPSLVDHTTGTITYSLDQWFRSEHFYITPQEAQKITNSDAYVPNYIKEAARALIYKISAYLFQVARQKTYGYVGTAGTNMFASNSNLTSTAVKVLNDQLCPEGNRHLIIDNTTYSNGQQLAEFKQAYYRGDQNTILTGELGNSNGLKILRDSQIPTHTAGSASGVLINSSGVAIGDTSVAIDTGTGTLVLGDVFTVAGDTQTYVVTTAVADVSSATLTFDPPAKVAWANNAAVTVKGTRVCNFAFDPGAFAFTMAYPDDEDMAVETLRYQHPTTGVLLTLKKYLAYKAQVWEFSALYGGTIVDPTKIVQCAS